MKNTLISSLFCLFLVYQLNAQVKFASIDTLSDTYVPVLYLPLDFNQDGYLDIIYTTGNNIVLKESLDGKNFKNDQILFESNEKISNLVHLDNNILNNPSCLAITVSDKLTVFKINPGALELLHEFNDYSPYGRILESVDFNQDGLLDLIFAENGIVMITYDYINQPIKPQDLVNDANKSYYRISVDDLNNDNIYDLVGAFKNSQDGKYYVNVLHQDGAGSFTQSGLSEARLFEDSKQYDLNNDGYKDVIYCEFAGSTIHALIYNIQTNTYDHKALIHYPELRVNTFQLDDINNDGNFDIVIAFAGIQAWLGDGQANYSNQDRIMMTHHVYELVRHLMITDLDKDGIKDVFAGQKNHFVLEYHNNQIEPTEYRNYVFNPEVIAFKAADLDLDGGIDYISFCKNGVVKIDWTSDNFEIIYTQKIEVPLSLDYATIFDYDQDGDVDLFFHVPQVVNDGVYVIENDGNQVFKNPRFCKYFVHTSHMEFIDLNNDNICELVISDIDNTIYWLNLENTDPSETFKTNNKFSVSGNMISYFSSGDFNLDNYIDLITINIETQNISILINDKLGGFSEVVHEFPNHLINGFFAIDYNEDGNEDLIIVSEDQSNNKNTIYFYQVDNMFNLTLDYSINIGYTSKAYFHAMDFSLDDQMDILLTDLYTSNNYLFRKNYHGQYEQRYINLEDKMQKLSVFVDINNDEKTDVVFSSMQNSNLYYQINESRNYILQSEPFINSSSPVYPNPASNYVYIPGKHDIRELKLFNFQGKEFKLPVNNPEAKVVIDIRNLKPGFYFIKLNEQIHKFLKL